MTAGARAATCCLWDRTLCPAGGFLIAPVAQRRWPSGWLEGAAASGDAGGAAARAEVDVADGVLVASAGATAAKLFCDAAEGWIAYARGRLLLIKAFPLARDGVYAEHGAALACYLSDAVAELEPMSPRHRLAAGERAEFAETWHLVRLPAAPTSARDARTLAPLIRARIAAAPP